MVLSLGDLLERIRPVGTPGAPTDAGPQRERAALDEIAGLANDLARLESEADAMVSSALQRADEVLAAADRDAQRVRADLADRVAVARAAGASQLDRATGEQVVELAVGAQHEIARVRADADLDRLAARAVDVIWCALASASETVP